MTTTTTAQDGAKREKFLVLANNRVNAALKAISLIGNLANRSAYDYSQKDIEQIFKALGEEAITARQRFEAKSGAQQPSFQLK